METRDPSVASEELGVDARYKARGAEIERDCMICRPARLSSPGTSGFSTPCSR
jgi:hypothetical protein